MFPRQRPPYKHPFYPPYGPQQGPGYPFINYFKKDDGKWDFDKISNSLNQANKLIGQVDPIVKQVSSFMKNKSNF